MPCATVIIWGELERWLGTFGVEAREAVPDERGLFAWLLANVVEDSSQTQAPSNDARCELTSGQLADAFAGVLNNGSQWQGLLAWPSTWTPRARIKNGKRGYRGSAKCSPTWDPVIFGLLVREQILKKRKSLNVTEELAALHKAFETKTRLQPVRDRWIRETKGLKP